MMSQTFQVRDLAAIAALVVLEALLSADNALVLAMMVRHLPKREQGHALFYGLAGAFVFRLIAIVFAAYILKQWWLQALGAIYLVGVPVNHFAKAARRRGSPEKEPAKASFWMTVLAVEFTDVAFAADSVLAGVTFVDNKVDKLWVVFVGAMIGVILLRFAAARVIRLLEKYPLLDGVAYSIVAWVGIKLLFLAAHSFQRGYPNALAFEIRPMPTLVFWGVLLGIGALGSWWAAWKKAMPTPSA
jgi:YkoY family integral membrane protein